MKTFILFFSLVLFVNPVKAQERFFEFLPGWKNMYLAEKGNKYFSFGTAIDETFSNHYQFSIITSTGELIDAWELDLDTITVLQSRYNNDVSQLGQDFYISGSLRGEQSNRFYGTFIKFNSDFSDTLNFKTFNILPGNGTMVRSHISLGPNKFILGGFLQNTNFQVYPSLMQTDSVGNIIWRKNYFCGGNCDLIPYHILQAADGGYFFTCAELHNSGGSGSYFIEYTAIIKTDSLGNEQYRLHPGDPDNYNVVGWVLPTDDGNYITAYSNPFLGVLDENPQFNPESTIWLKKIDLEGNTMFDLSLIDFLPLSDFGNRIPYSIKQMIKLTNGDIIIAGNAGQHFWGFILKITQNGEPIWIRLIKFPPQSEDNNAGAEYTQIYGVTPTSDGGYMMAGEYFSTPGNIFPDGIQTAIAVKVDEYGCLQPGCQLADAVPELNKANLGLVVYPNPARETVNITVAENVKVATVRVYEVTGRVVIKATNGLPLGEGGLRGIDVRNLKPGMYLIEVETKNGLREIKRIVVE